MNSKDLILITGAARSGISIMGGVIHLCGAWGGDIQRERRGPRGSYENTDIRDLVIKPFLRGIRADIENQFPLPNIRVCTNVAGKVADTWQRLINRIIARQGYEEGPLFYASSSSCLIWPVWAKVFPDAQWVIVRRSDEDIVRACMMTGFMSAYKKKEEWQLWLQSYKERFTEMINAGLNVWQIWPQRMLKGKLGELRDLIERLNLHWDEKAVEDFIAPILWKAGVFEISGGTDGK